ncbi:hypothetical protein [Chromobacterium sp. Beijing]|uniref:hypothetical protein n=1 Tax=Chromobacterium sp. Beijing TaxID=2735795 RepID=UPI0027149C4A|nr:hypothetical protein [Chromobacterium sp. Beijing]UJB30657.1 phospholipase [Chromobacterium sp. Beijing]
MSKAYYCPLNLKQTREATFHCEWIVSDAEYDAQWGTFLPLNCGQAAFDAVHRAIAQARRSVDIICWGFQPSMHFIRDGKQPPIGQLLEQKAAAGVDVRVLGWAFEPFGINVTGFAGEPNLVGKGDLRIKARTKDAPFGARKHTADDKQYQYDKAWYQRHALDLSLPEGSDHTLQARLQHQQRQQQATRQRKLRFIGRGFGAMEQLEIFHAARYRAQSPTDISQQLMSAAVPTHHQKMVLIDMDDPTLAYGFVMGHNMLDEYWDTPAHSVRVHPPDQGRNGASPRQDISSRVSGPILQHLHHNFAQAWQQETGEDLLALRKAKDVHPRLPLRTDIDPKGKCMLQILRTQPQQRHPLSGKTGIQDIESMYLQAVNNALSYLYFENQYFRWPALADKINDVAYNLTRHGRDGKHGQLHVFVVTNASDEGVGPGTLNTYRMLDTLGRAELIPNVSRSQELDWRHNQWKAARKRHADIALESRKASTLPAGGINPGYYLDLQKRQADAEQALRQAEAALKASQEASRQAKRTGQPQTIAPQPRPGLKIHVCTLVAPDSPPYTPAAYIDARSPRERSLGLPPRRQLTRPASWVPVYIHSKLTLINDVFTTLGSANLNTRSMQVDSELNIAHQNGALTKNLRLQLWSQHTWDRSEKKAWGAQEDIAKAFKAWSDLIEANKKAQGDGKPPVAPLVEFYRDSPAVSNLD